MDPYTEVYTWGSNLYGQMGLEASNSSSPIPRICSFGILILQVSCGSEHSAFLSTQHLIYSMGSNSDGRLGINDKTLAYSSYPLLVEALMGTKISQISCGGSHSAAVSNEGEIYTWGKGPMLGHGDVVTRWAPEKLEMEFTYVVQASCGETHSGVVCIRNKEKMCLMWGSNQFGQLGIGHRENMDRPCKAGVSDVKEIACGDDFSLFLNTQGQVFSCGKGLNGQLGLGNNKDAVIPMKIKTLENSFVGKVSAGGFAGCVAENGELYVWGMNTFAPVQIRGCPKDVREISIGKKFLKYLK
jgi:alpha-tubulin suppressor-like RCC1 family protein